MTLEIITNIANPCHKGYTHSLPTLTALQVHPSDQDLVCQHSRFHSCVHKPMDQAMIGCKARRFEDESVTHRPRSLFHAAFILLLCPLSFKQLQADAAGWIRRVADFFGISSTPEVIHIHQNVLSMIVHAHVKSRNKDEI